MSFIIIFSCSKIKNDLPDILAPTKPSMTMENLVSIYGQVRGAGRLIVLGKRSGKFNFTFTSDSNDTFLQFRDMLGRKTLFMEINDSSLSAWDMIQNVKYSEIALIVLFPFLEFLRPDGLTKVLWGIVPEIDTDKNTQLEFESNNTNIHFESERDHVGSLTRKITFSHGINSDSYEVIITQREFGTSYPHLKRVIPESVPFVFP